MELSFHKQVSKIQIITQIVADKAFTSTIRDYQWQILIKGRLEMGFSREPKKGINSVTDVGFMNI